jgi:hypothetical protein
MAVLRVPRGCGRRRCGGRAFRDRPHFGDSEPPGRRWHAAGADGHHLPATTIPTRPQDGVPCACQGNTPGAALAHLPLGPRARGLPGTTAGRGPGIGAEVKQPGREVDVQHGRPPTRGVTRVCPRVRPATYPAWPGATAGRYHCSTGCSAQPGSGWWSSATPKPTLGRPRGWSAGPLTQLDQTRPISRTPVGSPRSYRGECC